MLVRSGELTKTMSRYLIQRIIENPTIDIHYNTQVTMLEGDDHLERVGWVDKKTGEASTHAVRHVFVMAGASPRTEWLQDCLALDDKGFILTGRDLETTLRSQGSTAWPLARAPQMLETSLPGVFAVGDVRAGNVKRVASAVGEGAISVHLVHRTLAEL
jgi:thioredoxin reductase (NADPH)